MSLTVSIKETPGKEFLDVPRTINIQEFLVYPPSQYAPSGRTGMNAKRVSAEAVKMPCAEARGALRLRSPLGKYD